MLMLTIYSLPTNCLQRKGVIYKVNLTISLSIDMSLLMCYRRQAAVSTAI